MQTLITLGLAFSLLVTYVENVSQAEPRWAQQSQSATVIRTQSQPVKLLLAQLQVSTRIEEPPTKLLRTTPLDLSIPSLKTRFKLFLSPARSALNLGKKPSKPAIRYRAELVYDVEKGENITGGKLNIKIPFG